PGPRRGARRLPARSRHGCALPALRNALAGARHGSRDHLRRPARASELSVGHAGPATIQRTPTAGGAMNDSEIHGSIEQMVEQEHALWEREAAGVATDDDRRQLDKLKVALDQCWDLLRQRRALRNAGGDPDSAEERPPEVVERYWQ